MIETWVSVPGFEQRYEVSNTGHVRGLINSQGRKRNQPHVLRPCTCRSGYLHVHLRKKTGATQKRFSVHRLVCLAFHGAAPSLVHEVGHRNGERRDNCATNLYWVTRKQNAEDRDTHGHTVWGEKHGKSPLAANDVREIIRLRSQTDMTLAQIGATYGVTPQAIWKIVRRKSWARLEVAA